ncbi:Ig-like domain-containing protein [Blastopirellula sp. JC732]|uniref:Ig-like domain-containing protein n=1 Tax=Blastopirellula sediminis TaxID=2894196 RepID=A0A9X1MKC9_9BACT|nr:Ig-like domain-containing protein [Blastopirellula sediminis]MCC9608143.1 Ig-like domain-containing protein [Blastopirellula sediminis]MCC9627064.1 Ig-like domain-containing protein [Blastopirellula sediminis]
MITGRSWLIATCCFTAGLTVMVRPAAAEEKDPARAAQVEALINRANKLYLPRIEQLSWQPYNDVANLPYFSDQARHREQVKRLLATPESPERAEAIKQLNLQFLERQSVKNLELAKQAIAARNFTYARSYITFMPDSYWSAEEKRMVPVEKFLERKRQALKLDYAAYLAADEYVTSRMATFAQRMAAKSWPCKASTKAEGVVPVTIKFAAPAAAVSPSDVANVAEWRRYYANVDSATSLTEYPPYLDWSPRNFHWDIVRPPHKHYPEKGYLGVSMCGLYASSSAIEYIRSDLESAESDLQNFPKLKVLSGRNWAMFVRDDLSLSRPPGIELLFIRTPYGYFYLWIHSSMPTGLDSDQRGKVQNQIHYAAAKELIDLLAGDIPAEPFDPAEVGSAELTLTALDDVELTPTIDKPAECRVEAFLVGKDGKPVSQARVAFKKPEMGSLSDRVVVTDAAGKAEVTYTSPTFDEMTRQDKRAHDEMLRAVEPGSGATDYLTITTKRDMRRIEIGVHPLGKSVISTGPDRLVDRTTKMLVRLLDEKGKPVKKAGEKIMLYKPISGDLEVDVGHQVKGQATTTSYCILAQTDDLGQLSFDYIGPSHQELKAAHQQTFIKLQPHLFAVDQKTGRMAFHVVVVKNSQLPDPIGKYDNLWILTLMQWLYGYGVDAIWDQPWLGEYMMANQTFPVNSALDQGNFYANEFPSPQLELDRDARRRFAAAQSGFVDIRIDRIVVADNGYETGWDLIHGSNSDWNDDGVLEGPGFEMVGNAIYHETDLYQQVDYRLNCHFKDRMDLEATTYFKDLVLLACKHVYNINTVAKLPLSQLTDFNVTISWPITVSIRKYKDGTMEYQGWPYYRSQVENHYLKPDYLINQPVGLTLLFETAKPGEQAVVKFVAGKGYQKNAWIGIIPADVPHGDQRPNDDADIAYVTLNGKGNGIVNMKIPANTPPGEYEFRMFPSDDDSQPEAAHSAKFRIE